MKASGQEDVVCFKCNKNIAFTYTQKIMRSEECPSCMASLHCCKMCQLYDPSCYNECKERIAERVLDKEKANFCDYFQIKRGQPTNSQNSAEELRRRAEALFKN